MSITKNQFQTKKIGEKLAKKILRSELKKTAFIIGLNGELGSGKTCFLQGLAKGLGIKAKILSPTFIIFRKFKVQSPKFKFFYHFDCYRLQKPKDILALGFKKIVSDPKNIVAIEWADKVKKVLPKNVLWLKFKFIDKNRRQIKILWKSKED